MNTVDWKMVGNVSPALLCGLCWLVWLSFLLIPALTGTHGTDAYSPLSNGLYVLMGLTFCLTIHVAFRFGARLRAGLFALVLFVLAYWF